MKLSGIFPAITTPFDHQGDLYIVKIRHNISHLNPTPVSGYVVGSAAGEGDSLSVEEKVKLWEEVAQTAQEDKILIAAVSAASVKVATEMVNQAAAAGYRAALASVSLGDRTVTGEARVESLFFRCLADQAKIPIVLSTGALGDGGQLPTEVAASLAEHPNIAGVYEGSGEIARLLDLRQQVPKDFPVLSGSVSTLYPCLAMGARAAVLSFASAAPYVCFSIEEAVRTREDAAARELQERVAAAAKALQRWGIPGLKCAMDLQGYYGGPPRLPLSPVPPEAQREIRKAFQGITG